MCAPALSPQQVHWKSGGTAGYGSFMAFDPATGRAAVALANCGNCASKAVDQLARLLLDLPPRAMPNPPLTPTAAALDQYTGCWDIPKIVDPNNRIPPRSASAVARIMPRGPGATTLVLALSHNGGSAELVPFLPDAAAGPSLLQFALAGDHDDVCLRPDGCGPMETFRNVRREVRFLEDGDGDNRLTLVLHVDGLDWFLSATECPGMPQPHPDTVTR